MATVLLNKANNFRANVTVGPATTNITFLVNGSTADCIIYKPPGGGLFAQTHGITAGNIAKFPYAVAVPYHAAAEQIQVQINPLDTKTGNATVTF